MKTLRPHIGRLPLRWLLALVCLLGMSGLTVHGLSVGRAESEKTTDALVAHKVSGAPVLDGALDAAWDSVPATEIALYRRTDGKEAALRLELRAAYTDHELFFYATWPGDPPRADGTLRNELTLHFDLAEPWPGARDVTCLVACHTAFSDGADGVAYVLAETIPPGRTDPLPAAGGWRQGRWHLEWSRPLLHKNLFDVQFDDLDKRYPFFVKIFLHTDGVADPVSASHELVFAP
jgi:hypothetical protein